MALGVAGVLLFFGYLWKMPETGETQQSVCVLLVDRTGSSIAEGTRASYERMTRAAVEGCADLKASLTVLYFDNQNAKILLAEGDQPFHLYRPMARREKVGLEEQRARQEAAARSVSAVFETDPEASKGGHGSDIVTALQQAAQNLQALAARDGVDQKYLVVLTDGQQTGPELGMGRRLRSPADSAQPLLAATEELGLVPSLRGVQISFVGVGGGVADSSLPAWKTARIRDYWTGLVELGGGRMCQYGVEAIQLPGNC